MKLISKKTKKVIMIICLVILISSILTGVLGANNNDDQNLIIINHEDDLKFINDELIVKLKADVFANGKSIDTELNQLLKKHKFTSMSRIMKGKMKSVSSGGSLLKNKKDRLLEGFNRTYKIKFEGDISKNIHRIIKEYNNLEQVEWAEPNYIYQASVQTNDPYTSSTGSWGQSYADLWGFHAIQLDNIWAVTRGSNAIVAVIDTGLDFDHEDLYYDSNSNGQLDAGEPYNVYINEIEDINQNGIVDAADFNGIDDDNNGYVDDIRGWNFVSNTNDPTDDQGHGSHCAGIIAAMNDNNLGLSGVAPDARIMALKGLNQFGSGSTDDLVAAIYYAVDNGAQILNNSWGGLGTSQLLQDAVDYANVNNCIFIAAAGNYAMNTKLFSPAGLDGVLAVGALNPDLSKADSSNYGSCVDVSAPGVDILSLRAAGTNIYGDVNNFVPAGDSNAKYYRANGTSMACPFVSGIAALLVSAEPGYHKKKVEQLIVNTTDELVFDSYYLGTGIVSGNDLMNQIDQYTNAEASINSDINDYNLISSPGPLNITGTAAGDSYILEYGEGNYPSTWYTLASGSQVFDDTLGSFTIADKDGTYRFRLTVQEGSRQAISTSLIWVDLSIVDGWPVGFKTMLAHPHTSTIEDIDNDGAGEIFIGTNGYCFGLKGDGTILPNWPQEQSENLHYLSGSCLPGPSIADIDNDNSKEIFWTNSNWPGISRWAFNGKNPDYTDRVNFPQNAVCPLYGKAFFCTHGSGRS